MVPHTDTKDTVPDPDMVVLQVHTDPDIRDLLETIPPVLLDLGNIPDTVHILDLKAGTDRITVGRVDPRPLVLLVPGILVCPLSLVCGWVVQDTCQDRKDHTPAAHLVVTMDHSLMVHP